MKTYLIDLDDTLIDSSKIYDKIYQPIFKIIQSKGFDPEKEALRLGLKKNQYGRYDTGYLCRELGMLEKYYQILRRYAKLAPLKKEVAVLFKDNKKIGIVSNSMRKTVQLFLDSHRLKADFIFSEEDGGCKKDDEMFWKRLIEKEKLNPEECLVVGDDIIEDVEVPKKLGFKTKLVKP